MKPSCGNTRCARHFYIFVLYTDALLQLPHPRTQKTRSSLAPLPYPSFPLIPCSPSPGFWHPQDTKNTRCCVFFVSCGSSALPLVPSLPFPSTPTRKHAHVGMFFVLGCLPAPLLVLGTHRTRKTREGRVFLLSCGSPALPLVPNTKTVPHWHDFRAGAPSYPFPKLSQPAEHNKYTHVTCFLRSVARLPYPSSQHENCASLARFSCWGISLPLPRALATRRTQRTRACHVFFVFGGSLPFPCSPSQRMCPHGHVLRAPLPPRPSTAL